MPRILYSHLLTEAGLDLLTESGDDLVLREIGIAGDLTATGGLPGTVAGSGRVIAAGTGTVSGEAGTVAGNGTVILRGTCTAHGQAGIAVGAGEVVERKLTNARWLAQLRKMDEEMLLLWA